ncbi:MAG: heme exporter protein CcmB [Gammaproteobacteria bacterium]|nr:MAG: heme exporter protein CcmB [Gammaproteobacteria bacterium]
MSTTSTGHAFIILLKRDIKLAFRNRSQIANPLFFFLMVVTLFPLAISPERSVLQTLAPGVIWVAALLSSLLSLDAVFRSDYEDGSLEQILMSRHPAAVLMMAKVLAHWLLTGLLLLLIAPLLAGMLYLPMNAMLTLVLSLLLGTPVFSLVGAVGVALTVGLGRGGVLLSLLVIPLYLPVLIFGASAVDAAAAGLSVGGQLTLLAAMLVLAITLSPWAIASSLRISLN